MEVATSGSMFVSAATDRGSSHINDIAATRDKSLVDPETLSDRELFNYCQRVGGIALKARRHFIGLLPLVERRRLYERFGSMYSVYDFAAKMGGIGKEIVTEVLRLDGQLKDFRAVQKLLYSGRVSWSKIRMVMHWVTEKDQKIWIEKLETLSIRALGTYIRDFSDQMNRESRNTLLDFIPTNNIQYNSETSSENEKNLFQNKAENFGAEIPEYARDLPESQNADDNGAGVGQIDISHESIPQPTTPSKLESLSYLRETMTFSVRSDLAARLRLFRQKLEKERKEITTWEEVMDEFLKRAEENGNQKAEKNNKRPSVQQIAEKISPNSSQSENTTASRHIPNAIKREVLARYSGLCAFRDCAKPAEILHHTRRFALTKDLPAAEVHNPDFIKPLCKAHERIVHATLIQDEEIDPSMWKLLPAPDTTSERYEVDQAVMSFRKPK